MPQVGRLVLVALPTRATVEDWGASVEDFKFAPQLGVMTLYAEGSNYRQYTQRILLSSALKDKLRTLTYGARQNYNFKNAYCPWFAERHSGDLFYGRWSNEDGRTLLTDITLGFEPRDGKMPKMFLVGNNHNNNYIALVRGGSGYRGGYSIRTYGQIEELTRVNAGGSCGDIFVGLWHVHPPAMLVVDRSGRLYGHPPNAVAFFSVQEVKTDEMTDEEVAEVAEMFNLAGSE